jgi:prepilin-type N-terminal cleavage/methylation domain-containing protein
MHEHRCDNQGFTLIELTVVVFIISLMFFFAVPKFGNNIFSDNNREVYNWISGNVRALKEKSVREQKDYAMHIDLDENNILVFVDQAEQQDFDTQEEESGTLEKKEYNLPGSLEIIDVEYPGNLKITSGQATIFFYKKGYSDKVFIHIQDDDNNIFSFLIESFLTRVKRYETYVEFEDS